MRQNSLLDLLPPQPAAKPKLQIEQVPDRIAIAPDRFYVTVTEGDLTLWRSPIQLTEREARALASLLQVSDCTAPSTIYATLEQFIDDRLPVSVKQKVERVQR